MEKTIVAVREKKMDTLNNVKAFNVPQTVLFVFSLLTQDENLGCSGENGVPCFHCHTLHVWVQKMMYMCTTYADIIKRLYFNNCGMFVLISFIFYRNIMGSPYLDHHFKT